MIQHHILIEQRANPSHAFPSHPQLLPRAICCSFVNNGAQRYATTMCFGVLQAVSPGKCYQVQQGL